MNFILNVIAVVIVTPKLYPNRMKDFYTSCHLNPQGLACHDPLRLELGCFRASQPDPRLRHSCMDCAVQAYRPQIVLSLVPTISQAGYEKAHLRHSSRARSLGKLQPLDQIIGDDRCVQYV